MLTYLFTVQEAWDNGSTLTVGKGIRMNELSEITKGKNFVQGIALELLLPDKTKQETFLLNYGISAEKQGEELIFEENPYVHFLLPQIGIENLPVGTEIWWLEGKLLKNSEEIEEFLTAIQTH